MDQSDDHSHKRSIRSRAAVIRAAAIAFFDVLPEHTFWHTDTAMLDAIADATALGGARGQRRAWVMDALWGDASLVHRYRRAEMDDQARRVRGVQRVNAVQALCHKRWRADRRAGFLPVLLNSEFWWLICVICLSTASHRSSLQRWRVTWQRGRRA